MRWKDVFTIGLLVAAGVTSEIVDRNIFGFFAVQSDAGQFEVRPWAEWLAIACTGITVCGAVALPMLAVMTRTRHGAQLTRLAAESGLKSKAQLLLRRLAAESDKLDWDRLTVRFYQLTEDESLFKVVAEARNHDRQSLGIEWTVGKGCVGLAWQTKQDQFVNLARSDRAGCLADPDAWAAAPPEMQQGLSWQEAKQMDAQMRAGGYGAVAAFPVNRGGEVIGVLAIDVPAGFYRLVAEDKGARRRINMVLQLSREDLNTLCAKHVT